jgi:hypothetical protein
MKGQKTLWPAVRQQLFDDLSRLHEEAGPWDLILFTGDLTQTGTKAEFEGLTETLERLWAHLEKLGSKPLLFTVPGNHDLVRPKPTAVVKALRHFHEDRDIQAEFWRDARSEYRATIVEAFAPYAAWARAWADRHLPPLGLSITRREGILPGDVTATIEKEGIVLGVAGFNSAFLQLTADNYEGRLHLDPRQLHEACGGDGPDWIERHHVSMLLTHHPPEWLHVGSLAQFRAEIAPPGWFQTHLFGHMHEPTADFRQIGGAPSERRIQAASLFGLEGWGDGSHERIHGYSAGRFEIDGEQGTLAVWPRIATLVKAGFRKLVPDQSFDLDQTSAFRSRVSVRAIANKRAMPSNPPAVPSGALLQDPGGPYDPLWYIGRDAPEREALHLLRQAGQAVAIWGPELFGKTWLQKHLIARLVASSPESRVISINLRLTGGDTLGTLQQFLEDFTVQVVEALGLDAELVGAAWRRPGSPLRRVTWLFEKHLLPSSPKDLVLAVDQADRIWQQPWSDDFFGMLRSWSEAAASPPWSRLRLLVAMSTTPALLSSTTTQSPFANVAYEIRLTDLTAAQIERLAALHGLAWKSGEVERLVSLVGGHPFLTRLAMVKAARERAELAALLDEDSPIFEPFLDRLRWRLARRPELLEALRGIRRGEIPTGNEAPFRLYRAGLIDDTGGTPALRYRLYERLLPSG